MYTFPFAPALPPEILAASRMPFVVDASTQTEIDFSRFSQVHDFIDGLKKEKMALEDKVDNMAKNLNHFKNLVARLGIPYDYPTFTTDDDTDEI
jgi:hypothetical protein